MTSETYAHPQDTWDANECRKRSRAAPPNHFGDRPPVGLINGDSSPYPSYGQRRRYNGGCIRGGEWYQSEEVPLPIIPDAYEFVQIEAWGLKIQKKNHERTKK